MSYQNIVLFVWTCQPAQHSNIYILHNLYLIVISKLCFLCLNILTSLTEQHWSAFEEGLAIFQPIADGRVFRLLLFFLVRLVPQKYIYIIFKMNLHTKMLPVKSATQVATQPLLEFHSVKHKSFREDSAVVVRTIMFQFCFQLNTHTFICWIPECWPLHYECVRASQMFFLFGCVFSRCTNKCVFR